MAEWDGICPGTGQKCLTYEGCKELYDVPEGQDPNCLHFGVECEPPCDHHCPCMDCSDTNNEEV